MPFYFWSVLHPRFLNAVLKANATFPDKTPASSAPLFEQQVNEAPPPVSSHRAASLRQLSSNFSQFNNLHSPLRSRKPLTRKEAAAINEWSLLEEVFSLKSFLEGSTEGESLSSNHDHASAKDDTEEKMVSEQKLKLRSNLSRSENDRKRLQQVVDVGLKKLQKLEFE
ncbi:ELECTRON CARRIER/IRON ION-BINDING PROTEIN [Salix koriyanagi]|uniref:ELECTRON CARRIER/IRON ION-BINDING PROTEIN n=1 Tax=Salix koriyanagi TaxID=2511006 RepID=A0A9Q0PWZ6_9ROSI|nr:ELECTRON CARRIER/IRON ION-BINDING PROTEIN [Salix koriyanagi]